GNTPFAEFNRLKVLRLAGKKLLSGFMAFGAGNGLFGEVVSSNCNCCPSVANCGEASSVLITACCPGVGCNTEGSARIVVVGASRRNSPSQPATKNVMSFMIGAPVLT